MKSFLACDTYEFADGQAEEDVPEHRVGLELFVGEPSMNKAAKQMKLSRTWHSILVAQITGENKH